MSDGYITLPRKLKENPLWDDKPFAKGQAMIDLLFRANWKSKKLLHGNQSFELKRGEFLTSMKSLSEDWDWCQQKVKTFLTYLEKDGTIKLKITNKYTIVTVCKYDSYQLDNNEIQDENKNKSETNQDEIKTKSRQSKKDNKDKKGNEVFTPPNLLEVIAYFNEKGYTTESATKAFDYYEAGKWKDSQGTQVKNWKQKMVANWFEEKFLIAHQPPAPTNQPNLMSCPNVGTYLAQMEKAKLDPMQDPIYLQYLKDTGR